jgi:tetratricopeptide (TPR) repeat protein
MSGGGQRTVNLSDAARVHNQEVLFVLIAGLTAAAAAQPGARSLYQQTQYQQALELLKDPGDVQSLQLAAQCWYGLEDYRKATEILERAIAQAPTTASLQLWLGRAYGRRAETSSFLSAPRHASKARQAFERAVQLDPRYVEAMNDLFEYYMQAPGFLGGGKDKAEALMKRIAALDKAEGYFAEARLLEDRKDYAAAEDRYRKAVAAAPENAGRVLDLAKFLARRGRFEESERQFDQAHRIAPNDPNVWFQRAATYVETKRNQAEARALLERYLKAPLTPDHPPRKEAAKLLKQL